MKKRHYWRLDTKAITLFQVSQMMKKFIIKTKLFHNTESSQPRFHIFAKTQKSIPFYRTIQELIITRKYLCQKFQQQNLPEKENQQVLQRGKAEMSPIALKFELLMLIISLVCFLACMHANIGNYIILQYLCDKESWTSSYII